MANDKIRFSTKQAEKAFSNYTGELGGSRNQFAGVPRNAAGSFYDSGNPQAAAGVAMYPDIEEIVINISNTDHVNDLNAPLFSYYQNYAIPFNGVADNTGVVAGTGVGIIITPKGYTYAELQKMTGAQPMTALGLRYNFGSATQLKLDWTRQYKSRLLTATRPYYPSTNQNLANNITNTLDDPNFFSLLDGGTTIFVSVLKAPAFGSSTDVQVVFRMQTQVETQNILKQGASVLASFGS